MAYVPPHKRRSKEANSSPAPTPFPFQNPGHRNPTQRSTPAPTPFPFPFQAPGHQNPKQKSTQGGGFRKILYSKESIWRWFVIPSNDQDGELSCSVRLKEFTVEDPELKHGKKYAILVRNDDHPNKEVNENVNRIVKSPWVSITEKIQQDLLTSFQTVREEMCKDGPELNLPSFVIRFGKILFQRSPLDSLEALDNANKSPVENILSPLRKRFYTNVPKSFCKAIFGQFITKSGFDFLKDEGHYYVTVHDKSRPDVSIICKYRVTEASRELQLCKIGLQKIRQMVVDISCLEKNLDLRLLLSSKRILAYFTDDEKQSLNSLVNSAVIYSKVDGSYVFVGGKESVCGRYVVVGALLSNCRVYKSSFMRLKIKTVGDTQEVRLRIPELTSQLRDATMELNPLIDTVRDTLKLAWENFLCWEGSFT